MVAFLDDDDQWHPEKLARQVRAAERNGDAGVVYTGIERVGPDETRAEIPPAVDGDMTKALLCENVVGSMSVTMVRTELAQSVSLDERFPCWADLEWYINLSRETEFVRVPEPLVIYDCDSVERLSRDFEKTHTGYELFLEEFEPLAAEYWVKPVEGTLAVFPSYMWHGVEPIYGDDVERMTVGYDVLPRKGR